MVHNWFVADIVIIVLGHDVLLSVSDLSGYVFQ